MFHSSLKFFKKTIPHSVLIGKPFNSMFDASGRDLEYKGPITADSFKSITETIVEMPKEEEKHSNKELYDTNTAQQLSCQDINDLKKVGVAGEQLIQELVKHSETFSQKTAFSQAKYIKKKEQKYIVKLFVYEPTVQQLCRYYMAHSPQKINFMRFDMLGLILHSSDIHPGGNVVINESGSGIVLAAVAERMRGDGTIHYIYTENTIEIDMLSTLNLRSKEKKNIIYTNMQTLDEVDKKKALPFIASLIKELEGKANSLIIANGKYNPLELLKKMWKFLGKSGAFVVYHRYLEVR